MIDISETTSIEKSQFKFLLQSMTVEKIKDVIKYYNERYASKESNLDIIKGYNSLKKQDLIDFMDETLRELEKKEICSHFEPLMTKDLLKNALALISGEHKVEKLHQAALINGGKGYKIWFKGKYGMHETLVEVTDSDIKRSCNCRFSKLGGICIHQMALFLMLINKNVISMTEIPFKVDKDWFESIQKRIDLIATQSLFKEEPSIMLSNGYKIYINGDFVTIEWTGDFPGKKNPGFLIKKGRCGDMDM